MKTREKRDRVNIGGILLATKRELKNVVVDRAPIVFLLYKGTLLFTNDLAGDLQSNVVSLL